MPIPDYQTLMLPVLQVGQDGNEHTISEVIEILADSFHLSAEDRSELLPSGRADQTVALRGGGTGGDREAKAFILAIHSGLSCLAYFIPLHDPQHEGLLYGPPVSAVRADLDPNP